MSSDPQVDRCLGQIREESRALGAELMSLPPDAWDAPTNCPPWLVRDLCAHIVGSGEGFAQSIERGLAGSVEPAVSPEQRERRQQELAAGDPAAMTRALDAITNRFEALFANLDEAGLAMLAWHRRGNRPVRWFAVHRLAEVAFHRWDLRHSLGREPVLAEAVAASILPTLLEVNVARTYAAGLSASRGTGERFLFAVADDPAARWRVTIHPDRLESVRGDGPADVTIVGSAAALALLVYGRRQLTDLFPAGDVRLDGDAAIAERFPAIFPRP